MKLIVGLGNPGKKYQRSRHNLGFVVIEALVQEWNVSPHLEKRLDSLVFYQPEKEVILARPQTMMNASGFAVKKLVDFFKIKLEDLWVVHDDLDLTLGKIKIKRGGGSAGHRGVDSIVKELGSHDFVRFRLGIGHPGPGSSEQEIRSYVLALFKSKEKGEAKKMIERTVEMIEFSLEKGLEEAMSRFHQ